jgi:hypothetical protein
MALWSINMLRPLSEAVAGHVAHADPAAAAGGYDVVVVAAHVVGGQHRGGDVQPLDRQRARQDPGLDPLGDLHLLLQALALGRVALDRFQLDDLLLQARRTGWRSRSRWRPGPTASATSRRGRR